MVKQHSSNTAVALSQILNLSILAVCAVYIAKNVLRDLSELRARKERKQDDDDDANSSDGNTGPRPEDDFSFAPPLISRHTSPGKLSELQKETESSDNFCEILVHNVAHTDLIFNLGKVNEESSASMILCRPRYVHPTDARII